jgi:hypothetical protein
MCVIIFSCFTYIVWQFVVFITILVKLPSETCIGKAVPLQAWSGPEGSRNLRFPDYMTMAQDSGKVVSLTHMPPLPPENAPGAHLCWRLSRPQGYSAIGRIMSTKNSNDTIWNRTSHLPICSTVPYPLCHHQRSPMVRVLIGFKWIGMLFIQETAKSQKTLKVLSKQLYGCHTAVCTVVIDNNITPPKKPLQCTNQMHFYV